jgi:prophage regulatory protein
MTDFSSGAPPSNDPIIPGWRGASAVVGRSVPSLKRDVREGRFPAPIELGSNQIGWRKSWIESWLASRPQRTYRKTDAAEPVPEVGVMAGRPPPERNRGRRPGQERAHLKNGNSAGASIAPLLRDQTSPAPRRGGRR